MSGLVTGNVTAVASTISHFQTRVSHFTCVCVCVCVFFLCVVMFASKANRFSSLLNLRDGYGWGRRGAMLCNIEARKLYMCMLDGRRIMAFGALGGMEILRVRFRWDLCEDEMGGFEG